MHSAPTTALTIVAHPSPDHSPHQRLLAWAILKSQRGQTVRQARLIAMTRPLRVAA
jgi:hypothetical protein